MRLDSLSSSVSKLIDFKIAKFQASFIQYLIKTGVNKQNKINDPAGGSIIDAEARTSIQNIIDALEANGITRKT